MTAVVVQSSPFEHEYDLFACKYPIHTLTFVLDHQMCFKHVEYFCFRSTVLHYSVAVRTSHNVGKLLKMSHLNFAITTNFVL